MKTSPWTTRPIFISSTFSDMMAERDVLRDEVFKALEEKLNDRRVRLEPIDLRWGLETSGEKEKEQKELMVLKVCLDEIKRSKPFFIGLIGDRYGWVPPEERMKAAEEEKNFTSKMKDKSVTALEIEFGVLASKDQLKRSFFFFREPLPYDEMPDEKRALFSDKHNTELKGVDTDKRLKDLKKLIIESVGEDRVFTYTGKWNGKKVVDLEEFIKKVEEVLWQELDEATKEYEKERPQTWEEEEERYLQDFIEDRTVTFSGREDVIKDLKEFALGDAGYDNWGKCVTGESGSGKSALLAKLYKVLDKNKAEGEGKEHDIILLAHAAGISLRSNSLQNMLTIWIKQLAEILKIDVSERLKEKSQSGIERSFEETGFDKDTTKEKSKFEDIKKLFAELLSQASVNKRVVILVDALNQFENTPQSKYVNWLPDLIPENSKFIFTAIAGEETDNLSKRNGMSIEELKEVNREDAGKIINALCKRYRKTLNAEAIDKLLEKKLDESTYSYSNPLWLTMAIDDFLLMDEDDFARMKELEGNAEDKLTQLLIRSAEQMPPDIEGMYDYIFRRSRMFGDEFVNGLLSYIGISRNGLRESDLEKLMENYSNINWEPLNFASFRRYLRNHLVQKGELGLWDFRHTKARESLKKNLLKDEELVTELHKNLSNQLDKLNEEDPLRLSEIIWHLFKCDDKRKAAEIYGSNWADHPATGEYSITIRDIIVEKVNNINWVSSMIAAEGITYEKSHYLINNTLFNLDDKIKDFVQLKLLLKFSGSLLSTAEKLRIRNPDSVDLARDLSLTYDRVGDVYTALSDTKTALENYESSLKIRVELWIRNPVSVVRVRDVSVSYNKVGNVYRELGDTRTSLENYESSLKIREYSHRHNPDSADVARDLSVSYNNVGDVYTSLGDSKSALENFKSSLKIREELCRRNPDSVDVARDLSVSYDRVGDVYRELGDIRTSLENFESSLKIREELCRRNPDSADYARILSFSFLGVGDIHRDLGNTKTALENYESSLKIREELRRRNPDSADYAMDVSISYERVGYIYKVLGETKTALENYKSSLKIAEKLRRRNPDSAEYARSVSILYNKAGDVYKALGDTKTALENYESSMKIAEELHRRNPDSAEYARDMSISYDKVGDVYTALGDTRTALENYESSLKIREKLRTLNPDSADYARGLVVSYYKICSIYQELNDPKLNEDYTKFKESLSYMKEKNMFMDPPLVQLCEQLGIE